jgi:hypothetical protein
LDSRLVVLWVDLTDGLLAVMMAVQKVEPLVDLKVGP